MGEFFPNVVISVEAPDPFKPTYGVNQGGDIGASAPNASTLFSFSCIPYFLQHFLGFYTLVVIIFLL